MNKSLQWIVDNWPGLFLLALYVVSCVIGMAALFGLLLFFGVGAFARAVIAFAVGALVVIPVLLFTKKFR